MGLLAGIVGGAIKLGSKIISKARARKAERRARKAKKQAKKDASLAKSIDDLKLAISQPGGVSPGIVGADEVAQSGNVLNLLKGLGGGGQSTEANSDLVSVADTADDGPSGGGFDFMKFLKSPAGMVIVAVGAFFILKKMRILK